MFCVCCDITIFQLNKFKFNIQSSETKSDGKKNVPQRYMSTQWNMKIIFILYVGTKAYIVRIMCTVYNKNHS